MKKILVADPISPKGVELLKQQEGFEVIEAYGSSPEKVKELIKDASAVIVRSETKITSDILSAAKELKAVGRAGVGVDNIDLKAATENGVVVMNTPTGNTISTAELTFTHILCGARPIPQANASIQAGVWDRKSFKGTELNKKTLSILGMGRIGSELAKRAKAFGMEVLGYDPFLTESRAKNIGVEMVTLEDALKRADFITVHMPLTDATKYMLDEKAFEIMKKGVRVFNCARGGIIKESALLNALKSGKVASAGLDVYENEPITKDSPLLGIKNLVLTPHLGASTKEAQEICGIQVAELIKDILTTGSISSSVNTPCADAETLKKYAPYLNLANKLGSLLQQICSERVSKLVIRFFGKLAEGSNTLISLAVQKGYLEKISDSVNDVNAPGKLKRLGIGVEVLKSTVDTDYAELIEVDAQCENGEVYCVGGTIMGKTGEPKIVYVNGQDVEVIPQNCLLLLQNEDVPGIVGTIGSLLGKHGCNIANLTVSRISGTQKALSVYELDEVPTDEVVKELLALDSVSKVKVVDFTNK